MARIRFKQKQTVILASKLSGYLARLAVAISLILGSFPLPQKAQASEPPIDLPAFETTQLAFISPEIAITVVDSPGSLRVEAERLRKAQELEAKAEANRLEKLRIAQEAKKKAQTTVATSQRVKTLSQPILTDNLPVEKVSGERNRNFAPGNCTKFVADNLPVTWSGNAKEWAGNAKRKGYQVDRNPTPGSILQTNESWRGHVGIIKDVDLEKGYLRVTEMNYEGLYVVSSRTIPINSPVIVAVIHL